MMKSDAYHKLMKRVESQIIDETDWLANLSNISQLFGKLLQDVNWVGFYLNRKDQLILGPFWGNPAVTRIAYGKGVCGGAAKRRKTLIVPDVHAYPGHIVCDIFSQSEIVIPMYSGDRLIGVLDIDSPSLSRFDEEDQLGLEKSVQVLIDGTNWDDFFNV